MDCSAAKLRLVAGMDPASISDLIRLYDATAGYWDSRIHRGVYGRSYVRLFEKLDAQGWLERRDRPLRVLDCGIGAGLLTMSLAAAVTGPCALYGIDTSTKMLQRARSRMARSGTRATLLVGDEESSLL